jgi:hypothetical protein
MQEVADRLRVFLEGAYEMGMLEEDARQQGLKFKINQRIFRTGTRLKETVFAYPTQISSLLWML